MNVKSCLYSVVLSVALIGLALACKSEDEPASPVTDGDTEQEASAEEVWCDTPNRLCWQNPSAPDALAWEAAKSYCDTLVWAGHNDWRLPSVDELRSIVKGCPATTAQGACGVTVSCAKSAAPCYSEACNGCVSGAGPDGGCFRPQALEGPCQSHWSQTAEEDAADKAWLVDFALAKVMDEKKTNAIGLRCVRSYSDAGEDEGEGETESEREEDGDHNEDGEHDANADGDQNADGDSESDSTTACVPGSYQCNGDWLQICSGSGQSWGNHTNCAADGKTCVNGACVGGGGKCGCSCVDHACSPSPSGTSFTYQGCANWPDADQCSGFLSTYCEEECAGSGGTACFDNCSAEFGGKQFDGGQSYSMGDCTITIHCP